mgnify:CR=1 FL=1
MKAKISLKEFLFAIFFYLVFVFFLDFFVGFLINRANLPKSTGFFDLFVVYSVLVTVVLLVLYKLFTKKKYSELGIKKLKKEDFSLSIKVFFMLFPIAFISRILDPTFDLYFLESFGLLSVSSVLIFTLYLPFFAIKEEIYERSFFQGIFSKGYSSIIAPALIAINFAIAHYYNTGNPVHTLNVVLSVLIGTYLIALVFEKTRNIFASIMTHLIYNIFIIFQIYLHVSGFVLFEIIFWIIWGILFLAFLQKTIKELRILFLIKIKDLNYLDWLYILGFGIIIPIIVLLILESLV